jgi:3-phenylpropionate/trans-cinnamate dioxygenase subunit alpha
MLFDVRRGLLERRAFSDREIYEAELERIFGRFWLFVGPNAWLNQPGDFLCTYMGEEPVLLWKGRDSQTRLFLNMCSLSGATVCPAERGNAHTLVCPCHGLSYASDGHAMQNPAVELLAISRLEAYKGLLFACFDVETPPLTQYLGDIAWYLDTILDRRVGGVEVLDGPIKWNIETNWKLPVEALFGDVYRQATVNASAVALQPPERALTEAVEGFQISAGAGGLAALTVPSYKDVPGSIKEYEQSIRGEFEASLGAVRAKTIFPLIGGVFPNLTFDWRTHSMHLWHPRGPDETQVWTYCLVDKLAPSEVKAAIRRDCQFRFGPAGIDGQEDVVPWQAITEISKRRVAKGYPLNLQMGLGREGFHEDLPGKVTHIYSEMNQRYFYRRWQNALDAASAASLELDPTLMSPT